MTNDTQITVPTLAPNAENMAALAAWAENVPKAVESARKPTVEEAEAILTLVRGGWLRLTLDLNEAN